MKTLKVFARWTGIDWIPRHWEFGWLGAAVVAANISFSSSGSMTGMVLLVGVVMWTMFLAAVLGKGDEYRKWSGPLALLATAIGCWLGLVHLGPEHTSFTDWESFILFYQLEAEDDWTVAPWILLAALGPTAALFLSARYIRLGRIF